MYILKVKAFADFDIPYDINIAVFSNSFQANYVRDELNNWIRNQSNINQDIRLIKILENNDIQNEFLLTITSALANWYNRNQIASFVTNFFEVIKNNYIYLNTSIFIVEEILDLTDLGGKNYGL